MYTKLDFSCQIPEMSSVLISLLSVREEFVGFEELENGQISSHINTADFSPDLSEFINLQREWVDFSWAHSQVPAQNWNAVWEANYEPVIVGNFCHIRAHFHPSQSGFAHEILITPKMSFGTGHHATTHAVIELMQGIDFSQKRLLDYGSGTGILAILGAKMGASEVIAVDIEEWAYHNCVENAEMNQCPQIIALHGDISVVENSLFERIVANINRNVLLDTLHELNQRLAPAGMIILSGFYAEKDAAMLISKANELGLICCQQREKDNWAALLFEKKG